MGFKVACQISEMNQYGEDIIPAAHDVLGIVYAIVFVYTIGFVYALKGQKRNI